MVYFWLKKNCPNFSLVEVSCKNRISIQHDICLRKQSECKLCVPKVVSSHPRNENVHFLSQLHFVTFIASKQWIYKADPCIRLTRKK